MRYYCLACEKLIEIDSDDPKALSECPVCKGELEDGGLSPGTEINGYEIIEELGRGSYGIVYCAKQLNLERDVALKILSRNHEEEDFVLNFFREARAAAGLSHPNIVQAYDAGITDDGICYFAMELVDGETVDDKLENEGALRADEAYNIALKIAGALEYAWDRRKLTHGDIKPENIIISRRGEPKLADLGLAKSAFDEDVGHIAATPLYAPPEVIKRNVDSVNVQTDIYSFGGTVYHMFAGVPPFNEEDSEKVMKMHLYDKHEPLYKRVPIITRELSDFVDRMLAKDPAERPASWTEVVEFFEDSAEDSFRPVENEGKSKLTKVNQIEKLIPTFMVVVLLLVTGWFVLDYFSNNSSGKSILNNGNSSTPSTPAPQTISNEARWLRIKLNLAKESPGKACDEIDSFVKRFQVLTPAVKKDIENTREYYLKAEKDRLKQVEIEQKVTSGYEKVMEDIEFADRKNSSVKTIQQTINKIQDFLTQLENDSEMAVALGRTKRMQLSNECKKLQTRVHNLRVKVVQKEQSKQPRVWDEYKATQTRLKREITDMFKEIGQSNLWYQAFNHFISLPAESRNRKALQDCLREISLESLPEKQKVLHQFATTRYPEKIDLLNILISHRNEYVGKKLPWVDTEHGGGDFKVQRVEDDYAFMYGKIEEGAFSGFKLYWVQMPVEQQYLALEKWLMAPESKLTSDEKITVAFWILDKKGQRFFYNFITRNLSRADALGCQTLIQELLASRRESAAANAFNSIQKNWKNHNYNAAAAQITEFNKQFAMTQCGENAKELINKLNDQLQILSPIAKANSGASTASRLLDRSNLNEMLMATTYTANQTLDLTAVKEVLRVKILDNLQSAFAQIAAKAKPVTALDREREFQPLQAVALAMHLRRRYFPPALKDGYTAGLHFYAGDMQNAVKNKRWLENLTVSDSKMPSANPRLLLGAGMVADLYTTTLENRKITTVFENLIRKNSENKSSQRLEYQIRLAAGEYAIMSRQYNKVPMLLTVPDASSGMEVWECNKYHLNTLLAAASELNASPDKLKKIDQLYQSRYQEMNKKTKKAWRPFHDALWVTAVVELYEGNNNAFERLPSLNKCLSPKLSAALLCSVVASSEPSSGMLIKTIQLCQDVIGENVSSTELWYRVMLLEFAGAQTPNELIALLKRIDDDKRACAQPYVSRMVYAASIIRLLTGKTELNTEADVFKSFHDGLNAALPGEMHSQQLFTGQLKVSVLDKMALQYGAKSVFWPAMLGTVVANINGKDDADAFVKLMQQYSASLLPEERLLLQRLPLLVKSAWKTRK